MIGTDGERGLENLYNEDDDDDDDDDDIHILHSP